MIRIPPPTGCTIQNGCVDFGALGFFKIGAEAGIKVCNNSETSHNNSDIDKNTIASINVTENVSKAVELDDPRWWWL